MRKILLVCACIFAFIGSTIRYTIAMEEGANRFSIHEEWFREIESRKENDRSYYNVPNVIVSSLSKQEGSLESPRPLFITLKGIYSGNKGVQDAFKNLEVARVDACQEDSYTRPPYLEVDMSEFNNAIIEAHKEQTKNSYSKGIMVGFFSATVLAKRILDENRSREASNRQRSFFYGVGTGAAVITGAVVVGWGAWKFFNTRD